MAQLTLAMSRVPATTPDEPKMELAEFRRRVTPIVAPLIGEQGADWVALQGLLHHLCLHFDSVTRCLEEVYGEGALP